MSDTSINLPASMIRPGDRFASGRRITSVTHQRDGLAYFTSITYVVPHYGPRTDVYLSTRELPMAPGDYSGRSSAVDTAIHTVPACDVRAGDHLMSGRRVSAVLPCGRKLPGGGRGAVDIQWEEPIILSPCWFDGEWCPRVECQQFSHTRGMIRPTDALVQVLR